MTPEKREFGSWQCQHCYLTAMITWRGSMPTADDSPSCCFGEPMLPYSIPLERPND